MAVTDSPGAGRVLIAVGTGRWSAEPSWTRFDNITACRCYGYDCYAGRQTEFDTTDTGTASVYFHDQDGSLDDVALVGCQIMLQLYNPVTAAWQIRWRGHIDQIDRTIGGHAGVALADTALPVRGDLRLPGGSQVAAGGLRRRGRAWPTWCSTRTSRSTTASSRCSPTRTSPPP